MASDNEAVKGDLGTTSSASTWLGPVNDEEHTGLFIDGEGFLNEGLEMTQEHNDGTCEPCLFFTSKRGCANGRSCGFCHLSHVARSAPRPRKQTRDKIKEMVEEMFTVGGPDLHKRLQEEAKKHTYAMSIIQGYLDMDNLPAVDLEATWDSKLGYVLSL
ncbi:unnamed protein product [Durusdinium trenchii]|uniref:C3H1-type domain-containing protein n=2 Tax=Durusdinium trenchii TaxID=1381693 RepID=A0ABP0QEK7_9DINO